MKRTDEEKGLLEKLASGKLDGMVGNEKTYSGYKDVYCGKYIKDEKIGTRYRQKTKLLICPRGNYNLLNK
jgi:hypothetical protein